MSIYYRLKRSAILLWRSRFHYFRLARVKSPFLVSAKGKIARIFAGNELGSVCAYAEVIVEDCYDMFTYEKHYKPSVIVDIGGNIGVFSKFCSLLFADADIYTYEPNPAALSWLKQNAENSRIKVFPYAVAEESGVAMLETECDSTISQISQDGDLPVECVAASEIAEGLHIDLLKIDCEGSEWSILKDTSLLKRTENFCLEYHLYDGHTLDDLKQLIEKGDHQILRVSPKQGLENQFGLLWSQHITPATSNRSHLKH